MIIFTRVVTIHLLIQLEIVESVFLSKFFELFGLFGQHQG